MRRLRRWLTECFIESLNLFPWHHFLLLACVRVWSQYCICGFERWDAFLAYGEGVICCCCLPLPYSLEMSVFSPFGQLYHSFSISWVPRIMCGGVTITSFPSFQGYSSKRWRPCWEGMSGWCCLVGPLCLHRHTGSWMSASAAPLARDMDWQSHVVLAQLLKVSIDHVPASLRQLSLL